MRLIRVRSNATVLGMFYGEEHEVVLTERIFVLLQTGHLTWLADDDEEIGEVVDE